MNELTDLRCYLTCRLEMAELYQKQGVIPGQCDTMELEQLIGRIKEIKKLINRVQEHIDQLTKSPEGISYYHCGMCSEDVYCTMECPCCGLGEPIKEDDELREKEEAQQRKASEEGITD